MAAHLGTRLHWLAIALVAAVSLAACSSLPIGEYSLQAYTNATTLKAETLALVARADEPYSSHVAQVDALNVRIDAAYEFAAGIPNNQLSAEQWRIMRDPNRNLYGGLVRMWRENGRLSSFFLAEAKAQIAEGFDYIICLEANKQAASACRSG